MKKLEENIIMIGDASLNYDEFISNLANLSIKNITDILLESRITLPRKINVTALRLALNEKIVIAKSLNLSDEELFRLRFYPFFNEYQLQKLFTSLYDEELFKNYRKYLMELIVQNSEYLHLEDNLVNKLLNVPNKYEDFEKYQEALNLKTYDFEGYFDGIKIEDYDDNILKSLTSDDIRLLGAKYNVSIPKRLKKDELIVYVKEVMESNGKAIPDNVNLDSQSIMMVQRFAKKNNIKITADLKKDECLNYLFHQVSKLDIEYKKEVLLNLYLGDSFVFDLAYVLKTEEKAPLPEVVVEEPEQEVVKETIPTDDIIVLTEEPEIKEEPKEEKQEVKETPQVVVQNAPLIDPKELVNIITASVKEIVVDVVKEIVPLFTEKKEEEVKTEEQLVEEKIYNYDNFTNQTNPNYDEELHHYIKNYDCKAINPNYEEIKIESDKFVINELAEENNETEVDLNNIENLTEEEKLALKKEEKERKRQAKIESKNLSKEEKAKRKEMSALEKQQLKEDKKKEKELIKEEKKAQKLEEKARLKEQQKEEKEAKRLEAEQNKIKLKEEKAQAKKDKKLKKKEDKLLAKQQAKEEKRLAKEKLERSNKNYQELQNVLNGKGDIDNIDPEYFTKFMQLQQFKMAYQDHHEKEVKKAKERKGKVAKFIISIIFIIASLYFTCGVVATLIPQCKGFKDFLLNTPFFKQLFTPFINWLENPTFFKFK